MRFFIFTFSLFITLCSSAQALVIRDQVFGQTGSELEPLPFVTIVAIQNGRTLFGTISDFDGRFELRIEDIIELDDPLALRFSYIGYETLTLLVDPVDGSYGLSSSGQQRSSSSLSVKNGGFKWFIRMFHKARMKR